MKGSQTEYNTLQKVALGRIDFGNKYPDNDIGMQAVIAAEEALHTSEDLLDLTQAKRHIPEITEEIITTTQKDLAALKDYFQHKGVTVLQPTAVQPDTTIKVGNETTNQFPVYCPRDILLNFRDLIIVSPNLYQSRAEEAFYYKEILQEESDDGRIIIYAPRPYLTENDIDLRSEAKSILDTKSPVFEAANVLIDGEHNAIYYQISHSGNQAGFLWLKQIIEKIYTDVTVYPLTVYNGTHLDTTIAILNHDTVALNPERIPDPSILPAPLKNRRHLFPDIIDTTHETGLSSKWIGMNTLSVSPTDIIVSSDQLNYVAQLESLGFSVFPHKLSYSDILEGGHHCTTSDLRRKENY